MLGQQPIEQRRRGRGGRRQRIERRQAEGGGQLIAGLLQLVVVDGVQAGGDGAHHPGRCLGDPDERAGHLRGGAADGGVGVLERRLQPGPVVAELVDVHPGEGRHGGGGHARDGVVHEALQHDRAVDLALREQPGHPLPVARVGRAGELGEGRGAHVPQPVGHARRAERSAGRARGAAARARRRGGGRLRRGVGGHRAQHRQGGADLPPHHGRGVVLEHVLEAGEHEAAPAHALGQVEGALAFAGQPPAQALERVHAHVGRAGDGQLHRLVQATPPGDDAGRLHHHARVVVREATPRLGQGAGRGEGGLHVAEPAQGEHPAQGRGAVPGAAPQDGVDAGPRPDAGERVGGPPADAGVRVFQGHAGEGVVPRQQHLLGGGARVVVAFAVQPVERERRRPSHLDAVVAQAVHDEGRAAVVRQAPEGSVGRGAHLGGRAPR